MKSRGAGLPAVGKEVTPKDALQPVRARSGATGNTLRTVAENAESYPPMTSVSVWRLLCCFLF